MWIGVQIIIFISLVAISVVLPEKVYMTVVGIGIIFTIFAVFVNWLLVVQIINISVAGAIGISIIEKRGKLFNYMYKGILRIDDEGNKLKANEDSKGIRITVICALIIVVLYFWNFYIVNGEFVSYFNSPLEIIRYYNFFDIVRYIDLFGGVMLLYYAWTYRSHGIDVFVKPAFINVGIMIFYTLYYGFAQGDLGYLIRNWFVAFTFALILIIFILRVNNILKSKAIAVAACFVPVVIAIILTFQHKLPFADDSGYVAAGFLVSIIAYCTAYGALMTTFERRK
ncbi:MAG: hypothetical protein RSA29_07485 [Clostridium sp.]|uniref:hypothetical protein n=1 Tax=Clostridium sp. TaxID=1506 RepID=UPI00305FD6FC